MRALLRRMGDLVAAHPARVVLVTVLVTVAMGGLSGQARPLDNSQASFAPDSPEIEAFNELGRRFSDDETLVLQVLVTSRRSLDDAPGSTGRVLTPDGVADVRAVTALAREHFGEHLTDGAQRPAIISFAAPVLDGAAATGRDPEQLSAQQLVVLYEQAVANAPAEQRALLGRLLAGQPSSATTGLMLVTLDAGSYADEDDAEQAQTDDQIAFASKLADLPLTYDALPFSITLVRGDDGSFLAEVQRLFGMAIVVVLLVLAGVLRARRGPHLGRGAAIRRTAADVALGLGIVVIANVWVRGLQVVLGPDGLGLVGAPSPPTNIVSILLIALGVDYAIHLSSRYRDELGAGVDPAEATRRATRTVGTALLLGALTTGVGFLTNLTSPIGPIQDLGVLAAVGLASAFLLTTTFMPAVRLLLDQRSERLGRLPTVEVASSDGQLLPRLALALGRPALDRPVATLVTGLALTLAAAGAASTLETEFDIAAFLPEGSDSQRAFVLVNEEFAGGLGEQTSVLLSGDVATTPVHNAQVAALDRLASSDAVVLSGGTPVGQSVVHAVRRALVEADQPGAPPELVAAVDAARAAGLRADGTVEGDVAEVYDALAPTGRLDGVLDLDPRAPGDEPAARFVVGTQSFRTGPEVVREDLMAAFADARSAGVDVTPTSDLLINDRAVTALSASQSRGLLIALVSVLLLLTLVYGLRLGQWEFGLLLMLPVAAVAVWTLGLMAVTGIPFDPITATVSALVIGVGIDFTIHLGERFAEDMHDVGLDPRSALEASLRHTGAALAGSALTTALGFAVLTTGTVTPFVRLGYTTIYAVGLSLFAVVAIQPAILLLWARRRPEAAHHLGDL